ncbi:MAG: SDR family oxidoreductase [Rhodobacteraceae bacterium]|nr:SDR family oxidoreductase [Paracoccaceae bacterium]
MHVLIIGAGGMLGGKLARAVAAQGALGGRAVTRMTLADLAAPPLPADGPPARALALDIAAPGAPERLIEGRPDIIFHLAAVLSGESEADFGKGYRVNLDATRALLEAIRRMPDYRPRLVYASTLAVYGAPFPDPVPDDFHLAPSSSYGTAKAMAELLVNDHSRRGFLDGVSLRLPTICIRPGRPNRAASSFFSSILREPLAGQPAELPVGEDFRHYYASPRAATGFFLHAAGLDLSLLGTDRGLVMPGVSATVGEQIEALRRFAGQRAVDLIRRVRDPAVEAIVTTWAGRYAATRARALGFRAEAGFDEILRVYAEDDMPA